MESHALNELHLGDRAATSKTFTEEDVRAFARITGDANPAHLDEEYAQTTVFRTRIVHGMLVGSLFSAVFGTILPGLGTIYTFQSLKFVKPVYLDDTVTATVTVKELIPEKNRVLFDCIAQNQHGDTVLVGEAQLMPPRRESQ
ncbi:MAG TPA: MaoC family dehydratase [Candidatus Izemoplasmatales bacterium]|nr:MaoC family dehydratase [Candidatus Izemoplasmatales bacterium]